MSSYYNGTTKQRAFYLCPVKQATSPFHIWGDLVTKAGFKLSDAPNTWDAFWNFFKPVQKELRAKGMRKIYAMGMQITTVGPNDGNGLFAYFMVANGGQDIVTQDGKLHTDDPKVREAAIRSVEFMTNCYKEGYIPPEALTWNDADDNNALPREAVRDGSRWHAVDRTRDDQEQEGVPRGQRGDGPAATATTAAMPCFRRRRRRLHPEGREERRGVQGFHEVLHAAAGDEREPEKRAGSLGTGRYRRS